MGGETGAVCGCVMGEGRGVAVIGGSKRGRLHLTEEAARERGVGKRAAAGVVSAEPRAVVEVRGESGHAIPEAGRETAGNGTRR